MAGRTATIPHFENLYSQVPFSGRLVLASHPWNFHGPSTIFTKLDNFLIRAAISRILIYPSEKTSKTKFYKLPAEETS